MARFKVEEELARAGFKVATGVTQDVAGAIAFAADGMVIADESRIVVMAATLTTDSGRRDGVHTTTDAGDRPISGGGVCTDQHGRSA